MDFVETKFFYKNHVLELNLKNENMSKKWPQKPKKCHFEYIHIQNCVTLEKYLKVVFLTEIVWKIVIFKIEKIMKIKNGSNKKIVFLWPLENYILDN